MKKMEEWLQKNNFKYENGAYNRRGITVVLRNECIILFEGRIVWKGDIGQDAINAVMEYLDL